MLSYHLLLSLLQLSGEIVIRDKVDNVYCREFFCVAGKFSRNQPLPTAYSVCPPASNFDCKVVDFKERQVKMKSCPEGKMWSGVGDEVVNADGTFEKGDRFALRMSNVLPPEWLSDYCSISGKFGLKKCPNVGETKSVMVQVALVRGEWFAVKPCQIEESPKPHAKVCWSVSGWVKNCDGEEELNCFCVMDTVEELLLQRNNQKVKVDGVGVRTILTREAGVKFEVSECSLQRVGERLLVASNVDLNGKVVTVRKGEEMVKCNVEKSEICYKKQWHFTTGEVIANFFMNGQIIAHCSMFEVVSDVCYELGWANHWRKYQCWGLLEHAAVTTLILVALIVLFIILVTCFIMSKFVRKCARFCCFCSRKVTKGLVITASVAGKLAKKGAEKVSGKIIDKYNENKERLPLHRPNRDGFKQKITRGVIYGLAASSQIRQARADCSNLELSTFKTECGSSSCILSQSMRVVFPAGTTTMCVKPREEKLSEVEFKFKTSNFRMECAAFEEYWTGDFTADSCAKFECSGQCPKQEDVWRKLTECGAEEGDYTIKTAAPGCLTNGCWSCSTSCMLIYPKYTLSKRTDPVKVFRCREWLPVLSLDVVKKENGLLDTFRDEVVFSSTTTVGPFKVRWLQMNYPPNFVYSEHFLVSGDRACIVNAAVKGNIDPKKIGYVQCNSKAAVQKMSKRECLFDTRDISCNTGSKNEVQCSMLKPSWEEICKEKWLPLEIGGNVLHKEGEKIVVNINSFGTTELAVELEDPMVLDVVAPKASCVIAEGEVTGCYNCLEGAKVKMFSESKNGKPSVYVKCEKGIHPFTFTCSETNVKVSAYESEIDTECIAMIGFHKTSFRIRGSLRSQIKLPNMLNSRGSGSVLGPDSELPSWSEIKWKILGPTLSLAFLIPIVIVCVKFSLLTRLFSICKTRTTNKIE